MSSRLSVIQAFRGPIVAREALARSRSLPTSVALTLSLIFVGIVAAVMFSRAATVPVVLQHNEIVVAAYQTMAFQLVLVVLAAAALASRAIAGEREQRTFDMLVVSGLSGWEIVCAKLLSALSYLALLVATALPVLVAVFVHAGIALTQLVIAELVTLATAMAVVTLGVFVSALCTRTALATVATYSVVLAVCVETLASGLVPSPGAITEQSISAPGGIPVAVVHPLRFANPWYAIHQAATAPGRPGVPVGQLARAFEGGTRASAWGPRMQPWQVSLFLQGAFALLFLGLAAVLVSGRLGLSWGTGRPSSSVPF